MENLKPDHEFSKNRVDELFREFEKNDNRFRKSSIKRPRGPKRGRKRFESKEKSGRRALTFISAGLLGLALIFGKGASIRLNSYADTRNSVNSTESFSFPEKWQEKKVDVAFLPQSVSYWNDLTNYWCNYWGYDPDMGAIKILIESGGDPHADSGLAGGLWQLYPPTAKSLLYELSVPENIVDMNKFSSDPLYKAEILSNPDISAMLGSYYYYQQLRDFGRADDLGGWGEDDDWTKSVSLAAAAYNGGPGSAIKIRSGQKASNETMIYYDYAKWIWPIRHHITLEEAKSGYVAITQNNGYVGKDARSLDYLINKAVKSLDSNRNYKGWRDNRYKPQYTAKDLITNPAILQNN